MCDSRMNQNTHERERTLWYIASLASVTPHRKKRTHKYSEDDGGPSPLGFPVLVESPEVDEVVKKGVLDVELALDVGVGVIDDEALSDVVNEFADVDERPLEEVDASVDEDMAVRL